MTGLRKIILRECRDGDVAILTEIRNDIGLQKILMALPQANSIAQVRRWVNDREADPQTLFFIIADEMSDETLGYIQLVNMDFIHGTGELGICLKKDARGSGVGSSALCFMELHALNIFGIRKIILQVLEQNEGAIRLYCKLGYNKIGVLKKHFLQDQKYQDVVLMEKLLS